MGCYISLFSIFFVRRFQVAVIVGKYWFLCLCCHMSMLVCFFLFHVKSAFIQTAETNQMAVFCFQFLLCPPINTSVEPTQVPKVNLHFNFSLLKILSIVQGTFSCFYSQHALICPTNLFPKTLFPLVVN